MLGSNSERRHPVAHTAAGERHVPDHDGMAVIEFVAVEEAIEHASAAGRQEGFHMLCPVRRAEDRYWGKGSAALLSH